MNFIDHMYIGVLPRSAHTTIQQYFSTFARSQQRLHNQSFSPQVRSPSLMALYWHNAKTNPTLRRTLQCLRPPIKATLCKVLTQTWQKVVLALLQRARNVQTVIDALVYNHAKKGNKMHRTRPNITPTPAPCGRNLVQTLMQKGKHIRSPPTPSPPGTRCQHVRCTLYAAAGHNRGILKGASLFCPVCKIFNHVTAHTKHICLLYTSPSPRD